MNLSKSIEAIYYNYDQSILIVLKYAGIQNSQKHQIFLIFSGYFSVIIPQFAGVDLGNYVTSFRVPKMLWGDGG